MRDFPPQYAHFNTLDRLTADLRRLRTTDFAYEDAYRASWTILCMQIDRTLQGGKMQEVREGAASQDAAGRNSEVEGYWQFLEDNSIFPVFRKTLQALEGEGIIDEVIQSWKNPGNSRKNWKFLLNHASHIYPNIYDSELAKDAFGEEGKVASRTTLNLYDALYDLNCGLNLLTYTASLVLLNSARAITHDQLQEKIDQFEENIRGGISIRFTDKELYMRKIIERVEPYHKLASILKNQVTQKEQELFGDNAQLAGDLWRAALFIRGESLPQSVTTISVRNPLLKLLVDRDYGQAREYVEDFMAKYPDILPEYVANNLGIEPEVLRDLYEEEKFRQGEQEDAKKLMEAKKLEAREAERKSQREKVREFVGKTLISPDGEVRISISEEQLKAGGFANRDILRFFVKNAISKARAFGFRISRGGCMTPGDILAFIELFDLKPQADQES